MSAYSLLREARQHFPHRDYLAPAAVRALRRGYIGARLQLGDRWVFAKTESRT